MQLPRTAAGLLLGSLALVACASRPSSTSQEVTLDRLLVSAQALTNANYTFDAQTARALAQARVRAPQGVLDAAALEAQLARAGFTLRTVGPAELKVFVVEARARPAAGG